jgi:phosphoribosylaminoimidazolecarboxamide formyltransferase/IMP cyclohydrolase
MSISSSPRALLSVSDKTDIVPFARKLQKLGWEIISTGGTKKLLQENNIPVTNIESITKNPESFDGRMKSISFQIGSSLLFDRDNADHVQQAKDLNISAIDLVCCNLYPFEKTINTPGVTLPEAIEQIDIGGPTMVRAAAKNFKHVLIVSDPTDYDEVIQRIEENETNDSFRGELAIKAFSMTADYDSMIDQYLTETIKEEKKIRLKYENGKTLRYGENSHQRASVYRDTRVSEPNIPGAKQLHGKALSYNNYVDSNSALESVKPFQDTFAACVVKHNNPCGFATGPDLASALKWAWSGDTVSAFGSVIAVTKTFDATSAEFLKGKFVEIIIAPSFTPEAIKILKKKSKQLRLLEIGDLNGGEVRKRTYKHIIGGILEQDRDLINFDKWEVVTESKLPENKKALAEFSYESVKHIRSNAVVLSHEYQPGYYRTLAIGAGQPNRINALRNLAIPKAKENLANEGYSEVEIQNIISDSILSSDAFFPFRDTVDMAAEEHIKYIIQPGGSIKDDESITACNEHGMAMIFTGTRHFNH